MSVAVHQLTGAARSTLTIGGHIKEFPLTWAIGAFIVGVWLGSRSAPAHWPDKGDSHEQR